MIKLIKLKNNEEKIKEYNKLCDELKISDPDIDWEKEKLKSIDDKFYPYKLWIEDLSKEKDIKVIKDETDVTMNVYISHLDWTHDIEMLTDNQLVDEYDDLVYGVCDNASQIIDLCNKKIAEEEIEENKTYIMVMTPIFRKGQEEYGFRWHKWGDYIGVQNYEYEYLADEKNIDMIYVFHVKEIMENKN